MNTYIENPWIEIMSAQWKKSVVPIMMAFYFAFLKEVIPSLRCAGILIEKDMQKFELHIYHDHEATDAVKSHYQLIFDKLLACLNEDDLKKRLILKVLRVNWKNRRPKKTFSLCLYSRKEPFTDEIDWENM